MILNHPKWQRQYLENIRTIAEMLKWENLGPMVQAHRELIEAEVALDTRKLFTTEDFRAQHDESDPSGLKVFAEKRSQFLLTHPKILALD